MTSPATSPFRRLVRAYCLRELPGWGTLVKRSGLHCGEAWAGVGRTWVRHKWDGYELHVDPENWSERWFFLLGRGYDLPTQRVMSAVLTQGDHAMDVGANIGVMTLHACACVGPQGRVLALEPNPDVFARLRSHVDRNAMTWAKLVNAAAGDAPGTLKLQVMDGHTGSGTLRKVSTQDQGHVTHAHDVPVLVGDDLVEREGVSPVLIKIDVEGFETRVLQGLGRTLERCKPVVICEFDDAMLRAAGSSARDLLEWMIARGFEAFVPEVVGRRGRLWLLPLKDLSEQHLRIRRDVAFALPGSIGAARLASSMR